MKNIFKKNSIIITALAIMIVIAGYLSFTSRDVGKQDDGLAVNGKDLATTDGTDTGDDTDAGLTPTGTVTDTDDENTDEDVNTDDETNTGDELGSKDPQNVADNGEINLDDGTPGEAVLASTADADYYAKVTLMRENKRAKNKADYMKIIESTKASAADKKAATDGMLQMMSNADKESAAELILGAKGFSDSIVFINNDKVDVAINSASLTKQQTAIIEDVIKSQTGYTVDKMSIIPYVLQD